MRPLRPRNPDIAFASRSLAVLHDAFFGPRAWTYHNAYLSEHVHVLHDLFQNVPSDHPLSRALGIISHATRLQNSHGYPRDTITTALYDIQRAVNSFHDLLSLQLGLRTKAVPLTQSLPVFGDSPPPPEDTDLWSWDDRNLLVGKDQQGLEIQPR